MTKLITKRMNLRNFKLTDAASVYQYAKNPNIGPIAGWPVHTSVANSRYFIKAYFMSPHIFAITLKVAPEAVIGLVGLELVDEGNGMLIHLMEKFKYKIMIYQELIILRFMPLVGSFSILH
ncbi:GNAT family N-acetyltransferase [Pediococcus cellicola]|nr:GNAT family N-acetyltransferase [Pediococcus cellicola]GEL15013.1 hypothetical protein PCE01_08150 [Pediococcus cellicola]